MNDRGPQGDRQHPITTRLSGDTWVKIILAAVLHTGTILYAAHQYTVSIERRLTILETNQEMFMRLTVPHSQPSKGKP